jgi:DNA-binding winged helix-turn-helix (wHTH) protein
VRWLILEDFRLDITSGELTRKEITRRLGPKAAQVLLVLAQSAGEAVSREQFQQQVWRDRIVTDDALNRCISSLRLALGDTGRPRRYIETLPKLGYRLCCDVSFEDTGVALDNDQSVRFPAQD